MAAREDYYSFVEGDDIDSIILDRNILPLRKFPLLRGEDICYIIQNIAGRLHAATGEYPRYEEFIKFSNNPTASYDGMTCFIDLHNKLIRFADLMGTLTFSVYYYNAFVKKSSDIPDKSNLGAYVVISNGHDAIESLGLLESFEDEHETFLMYLNNLGTFISYEKFITYCMDLFWNKMMRQLVSGNGGGMYFLNDQNCTIEKVYLHGTMTYTYTGRPTRSDVVDKTKRIVDLSMYRTEVVFSKNEFTPDYYTHEKRTALGSLTWDQQPFLWPRCRARFTDGSKLKYYLLFHYTFYRYYEYHWEEGVDLYGSAFVSFTRRAAEELDVQKLASEVMKFISSLGLDTSDPEVGEHVHLSVWIEDYFAIVEYTDQMTISTESE